MKKALDFAKSHAIALSCALVAVVALIAYFVYPVPSLFGQLQTEVDSRKQVYDTLTGLRESPRTMPNIEVGSSEPKPLNAFPTDKVIKAGEEALQRLTDQSGQVYATLVKMNQRPLLVPNSLPNPTPLARQNFLEAYKAVNQQYGEAAKQSLIHTKLKGVLPPSAEELRDLENRVVNQILKKELQIGGNGQPVNQVEVDQKIAERKAKLPLEQRVVRALNAQIYVSPGAVDVIPDLMTTTNPPDAAMVFNAQFNMWVQSAVFEAIAVANAGSENVLTSPVKHLIRLDMPVLIAPVSGAGGGGAPGGFFNMGGGGAVGGGGEGEAAAPVGELKPDPSTPVVLNYRNGPLGFTSNSMFDPIPVTLTLRIDSRKLTEALAAMQGGQLLKIKNVNYRSVNMGLALQEGYVYDKDGSTPMVEVILDCDVLMLRSWIVGYMPEPVKQHFATLSSPPVAAQ